MKLKKICKATRICLCFYDDIALVIYEKCDTILFKILEQHEVAVKERKSGLCQITLA